MPSLERQGARIAFTDEGTGPPVVLGHSFLCSGEMWAPQLPALTARYRVVNVDYRGHGGSSRPPRAFGLYDLVDDVLAVLDELSIERAAWVGLSIGGMVALRAALAAPERVAGLVLLDTSAGAEPPFKRVKHRALALGARLLGMNPFLPAVLPLFFGRTTLETRPELVAEWSERFCAMDPASISRTLTALNRRDSLLDDLGRIAVPTAVVVGAEDVSLPPAVSRRIVEGIPGAELSVVPEAGHLASLEQPDRVTARLLETLGAIFAPPAQSTGRRLTLPGRPRPSARA
jgi:pimeloyl-ACP methyl ester carboxylesterase